MGRILGTLLDQRFSTGLEIEDQVKNSSENRFWVRNLQKENSMKVKEIHEYIDEAHRKNYPFFSYFIFSCF